MSHANQSASAARPPEDPAAPLPDERPDAPAGEAERDPGGGDRAAHAGDAEATGASGGAVTSEGLGQVLLIRPLSFAWLCGFFCLIAAALLGFLVFGEYTRKETVQGQIIVNDGLSKIYASAPGVVLTTHVKQGDRVRLGQPLIVLSVDVSTQKAGDSRAAIARQLLQQQEALKRQHVKQRAISAEEERALRRRIADLRLQSAQLGREIETQRNRLAINKQLLERYQDLGKQEFVSEEAVQGKEQDYLDQRSKLEDLERNQISVGSDIAQAESDLKNAPPKAENTLSDLERQIAAIEQQSIDNESRREVLISSQVDGVVNVLLAQPGQMVTTATPLVGIQPHASIFKAELYVPSRAVGFVKVGDSVLLRYQAYPFQKFGQYGGKVAEIARTALQPSELQLLGMPNEGLFRLRAGLDSQSVTAYGEKIPLQDGMQLEADILLETRKLYEWVLDPLYTISGKY